MKKIFVLNILLFLLLTSGCNKKQNTEDVVINSENDVNVNVEKYDEIINSDSSVNKVIENGEGTERVIIPETEPINVLKTPMEELFEDEKIQLEQTKIEDLKIVLYNLENFEYKIEEVETQPSKRTGEKIEPGIFIGYDCVLEEEIQVCKIEVSK